MTQGRTTDLPPSNHGSGTARVLVAGTHAIVREGLKKILSESSNVQVAGEAETAHALLARVRSHEFDVVLLDLAVPGRGGLELIREIRAIRPELPVVVLSMQPPHYDALRALSAGASGYLTRECRPAEMVDAVVKVAAGGKYITSALAEKLTEYLEAGAPKPLHATLSDREYQVMLLIASGKTVGHIAKEMRLSVKTVSTYRSRILEKMHMQNNLDIIRYVFLEGLAD